MGEWLQSGCQPLKTRQIGWRPQQRSLPSSARLKTALMLSNSALGLQGLLAQNRTFISRAVHISRCSLLNRLSNDEYRVNCAFRLGVDAFPSLRVKVKCPYCFQTRSESTSHGLCCPSAAAQGKRTEVHTAMDVAYRVLIRGLNPDCAVTCSLDA